MGKRIVLASIALGTAAVVTLAMPLAALAQFTGRVVGVGVVEGNCMTSTLVTDAGETMLTKRCSPTWNSSAWISGPNLFGAPTSGRRICGVSSALALAEDGGLFDLNRAGLEVENIYAASGQIPIGGEIFVGIDFRSNPTWTVMAVTNYGRLFYRSWVSSQWQLILDGPAGATAAMTQSWGQLKARYAGTGAASRPTH